MTLFYSHGKFFDNEEDFWKYTHEWPDLPLDLEEFKNQMSQRIREVEINNEMRGGKLTNREAYQILGLSTVWAMKYDQ